jgi:hypothetical protein
MRWSLMRPQAERCAGGNILAMRCRFAARKLVGWSPLRKRGKLIEDSRVQDHEQNAQMESLDHRAYVGGLWEEIGRLQFEFLLRQSLAPSDCFLDIAGGSLRGGVHSINFSQTGAEAARTDIEPSPGDTRARCQPYCRGHRPPGMPQAPARLGEPRTPCARSRRFLRLHAGGCDRNRVRYTHRGTGMV